MRTLEEEEKKARDALEEKILLRIMDQTEAIEVISNKVANLQERSVCVEVKEIKRKKKEA
jgi:hypothetical protein